MNRREQLEYWVRGICIHQNIGDECVPDYSCCYRELKVPKDIREKYFDHLLAQRSINVEKMDKRFSQRKFNLLKKRKTHGM